MVSSKGTSRILNSVLCLYMLYWHIRGGEAITNDYLRYAEGQIPHISPVSTSREPTNNDYLRCPEERMPRVSPVSSSNYSQTSATGRDYGTSEQLSEFKRRYTGPISLETSGTGVPLDSITASLTVGPQGPMLMVDSTFFDFQAHVNRERIPERIVHAKGMGAFGYFEVTHDITKYSKAVVFSQVGKRTRVAVRFSTSVGEKGSADTVRDPRGFAVKHYTEDGIWDIVGFNSPMFFARDPITFTIIAHSQKKNPVTNVRDADSIWDMISLRPELLNIFLFLFSDLGIPDGFRYMDGFADNTFKLVNANGEPFWCKFTYKSNQGIRNITAEAAAQIRGSDPDYSTRDLYNAIHRGEYPSWNLYIQVLTMEQAKTFRYNPFDSTKVWYEWDVPLIPVGKLVLNKNIKNFFTDVEQSAFCPGNLIPGIEPSPDRVLQGRMFAYSDAQRYRLGVNHLQLPINCPFTMRGYRNQHRDGFMAFDNQDDSPNYYPNSFYEPKLSPRARAAPYQVNGVVDRYDLSEENNFEQPRVFWRKQLDDGARSRLVQNIAADLGLAKDFIQERTLQVFRQVDEEFSRRVRAALLKRTN